MINLKKTLFGNYKAKAVDAYIENLRSEFQQTTQEKDMQIASLQEQLKQLEQKTAEIGEAVIYAKNLIIESRKQADEEARAIAEEAQKTYQETKSSMLHEIDGILAKRDKALKLYKDAKEQIAQGMAELEDQLEATAGTIEEVEQTESYEADISEDIVEKSKKKDLEKEEESSEDVDVSNVFRLDDSMQQAS